MGDGFLKNFTIRNEGVCGMKNVYGSSGMSVAGWTAALVLGFAAAVQADTVQVNIKSLLNARAVSTFSNGKIYTWTMGIDGGGGGDGYVTHSVAVHLNYTGHTLPDSALYPANANHPKMLLNFSNVDSTDPQTHYLKNNDSVSFSVPQGNYSKIYLALTSSEGSTTIDAVLNYSDGPATSTFTLNDYDQGLATGVFYVDSAMQKWSNTNSPGDNYGHALNGFGVTANSAKTLTSVKLLKKTAGSYLVLWGVTGVGTIATAVQPPAAGPQRTGRETRSGLRAVSCGNGLMQIANVKQGSMLTLFSLSGVKEAQVVCGTCRITVGTRATADIVAAPGVHVCEVRCGQEVQRLQVVVPR